MPVALAMVYGCGAGSSSDQEAWTGGVTSLRGTWQLYVAGPEPSDRPSQLPTPSSVDWNLQEVPAPFDLGLTSRADGIVTWWHRRVALAAPTRPALGVAVGKVNSSYELWVGPRERAERIGGIGSPPPAAMVDYDRHAVWQIPAHLAAGDSMDIWLRVWTAPQHGDGGGLHGGPFLFGALDTLVRQETASELPELFLAFLFLLLGSFHFELFRRRRDEAGYLWLAVVAFLFAAYSVLRTQWKYSLFGLPFAFLKEVEHAIAFVLAAAFAQLIWTLLDLELGRRVRAVQWICVAFAVAVIVIPGMAINGTILVTWQGLVVLLVGRGLFLIFREAWQKNPDAHLIAVGAILGSGAFVHDILADRELVDTPRLTAFGFATFVIFLAATLAEQFARRLREIEELRRSEEAAERANRAKSQFLANVSHEIRTPMTAILGGTELLLRDDLTAAARQRIEVIRRSASELLRVIDDILDVSKIEAGKMELRPEDFHPRNLVEGILALFQPDVRRRSVSLKAEVADPVPRKVHADAGRLRQILLNLVSNAVKFTQEGSVTLQVDYSSRASNRGELVIAVTDTGVGIEPEVLPRLFEPFARADESITRRVGGTGLGLTISRRLATLMGGSLDVESQLGTGSTFTLKLPVRSSEAVSSEIQLGEIEQPRLRTHRILLAEDNEVNRIIVAEQLEHLGFEVEAAENGLEVLSRLDGDSSKPVDLVLMDCQMPELDGYETTRRLRAREAAAGAPRMPIIALTAHAFEGEKERCLEAGMDDYMSKPFRIEDLQNLLDRWLQRTVAPSQTL